MSSQVLHGSLIYLRLERHTSVAVLLTALLNAKMALNLGGALGLHWRIFEADFVKNV
jgi:hypothetical protein